MGQNYVFLFGGDPQIMQLRELVLERAGFKVLAIHERELLCELAVAHQHSLLILNDMPPNREVHEALHIAHSFEPPLKTLVLGYSDRLCAGLGSGDQVIETLCEPHILIRKIREMMGSSARKTDDA
jgi:hypothetical protein